MLIRPAFSRLLSSLQGLSRPMASSAGVTSSKTKKSVPEEVSTIHRVPDASELVSEDLKSMFGEIHAELDNDLQSETFSQLSMMSKYYFDGKGKAIRPVIAMTLGHAYNEHLQQHRQEVIAQQRKVAVISEMIHVASLVHDDILDHAETRRGKPSVNFRWDGCSSSYVGDYILAVGSRVLARLRNEEVLIILSRVLADLVTGEFQQLQSKNDESERFQLYLNKTFNKTASLIAYSCKANAVLAGADQNMVDNAFEYGRNIGIAFQLIDDLLDFEASAEMLGKPAAADLKLGLATAPVLFASSEFPHLEEMIARRFNRPGDVEEAFETVNRSIGLDRTKEMAKSYCLRAAEAIETLRESQYKWALVALTQKVVERKK